MHIRTFLISAACLSGTAFSSPLLQKRVDFGVPNWPNDDTNLQFAARNTIANDAMNRMLAFGGGQDSVANLNYWPTANVWSSHAVKDLFAGSRDFAGKVLDNVGSTYGNYPAFRKNEFNDDTLWWGIAAMTASRAYGDQTALSWAEDNWNNVYPYFITSGSTSGNGKNFGFQSSCSGQTMEGGVWWKSTADDDSINAITTGLFMSLSAMLYEATRDQKYLNAAELNYRFIRNHLYGNAGQDLVDDSIHGRDCSTTVYTFTYNTGKYVEGLAILGDVTGDTEYTNAAVTSAVAGMKSAPWQGSDGIITEGQDNPSQQNDANGFKGIWIRALGELYRRSGNNKDLQTLIHSYVDVQANTLIKNSNDPSNPSLYPVNWKSPVQGNGYPWGQLPALDVMATFVMTNNNG